MRTYTIWYAVEPIYVDNDDEQTECSHTFEKCETAQDAINQLLEKFRDNDHRVVRIIDFKATQ